MDLNLSADQQAFQAQVRIFLEEHLSEALRQGARATPAVFAEPDIGQDWQRILHQKGWLAEGWPAEYGGPGWSPIERYIFERECALAHAPRLPLLGLRLLGPVLIHFGTDWQKETYLPKILSGEHYWCQGFSEAGAGSDLASLRTRAERQGDKYVVNGAKLWTTHGHHADHIFCLVRTNPEAKPQEGISFLLLDMNQPGVGVRPIIGLAGDHEVNEVFLDNAVAPAHDLVGEEGQGWSIAKFLLENERGGSCHAPRLQADLIALRQHARDTGSASPSYLHQLARVEIETRALETMEIRILADLEKGGRSGALSSLVKLVASQLRQAVDKLKLQAWGYAALQLSTERPLYGNEAPEPILSREAQLAAPAYLNTRASTIYGGTSEVQRTIIAKTILSL